MPTKEMKIELRCTFSDPITDPDAVLRQLRWCLKNWIDSSEQGLVGVENDAVTESIQIFYKDVTGKVHYKGLKLGFVNRE